MRYKPTYLAIFPTSKIWAVSRRERGVAVCRRWGCCVEETKLLSNKDVEEIKNSLSSGGLARYQHDGTIVWTKPDHVQRYRTTKRDWEWEVV